MNPRHYVDLKETDRNLQPTYYFMINCLLYSRMETGLVSNQDFYDEDVNVYLAHLLHSFINPEYVEQSKRFLSKYDTDVFRRLSNSTDSRLKYLIYKTNADFLLISIGIFDNPMVPAGPRAKVQPSEEAYIGRGKTYYHFAYSYAQQVHRKNQGVADVLEKLSVGFDSLGAQPMKNVAPVVSYRVAMGDRAVGPRSVPGNESPTPQAEAIAASPAGAQPGDGHAPVTGMRG